ncbi:hypothetical protein [Flavobacterium sp.]|uniref:hypothetical protein n=1 Tax=Flavobacterium sp. TaxID=239 RepID=UPI003D6A8721
MKNSVKDASSLADKLVAFSNDSLNNEEKKLLDAVLGVYNLAISEKNAPAIFGEDGGFLSEINAAAEKEGEDAGFVTTITVTRTILTSSRPCLATITTVSTIASHPSIGCNKSKP